MSGSPPRKRPRYCAVLDEDEVPACPVCMEVMLGADGAATAPCRNEECRHAACATCALHLITCPVCRAPWTHAPPPPPAATAMRRRRWVRCAECAGEFAGPQFADHACAAHPCPRGCGWCRPRSSAYSNSAPGLEDGHACPLQPCVVCAAGEGERHMLEKCPRLHAEVEPADVPLVRAMAACLERGTRPPPFALSALHRDSPFLVEHALQLWRAHPTAPITRAVARIAMDTESPCAQLVRDALDAAPFHRDAADAVVGAGVPMRDVVTERAAVLFRWMFEYVSRAPHAHDVVAPAAAGRLLSQVHLFSKYFGEEHRDTVDRVRTAVYETAVAHCDPELTFRALNTMEGAIDDARFERLATDTLAQLDAWRGGAARRARMAIHELRFAVRVRRGDAGGAEHDAVGYMAHCARVHPLGSPTFVAVLRFVVALEGAGFTAHAFRIATFAVHAKVHLNHNGFLKLVDVLERYGPALVERRVLNGTLCTFKWQYRMGMHDYAGMPEGSSEEDAPPE